MRPSASKSRIPGRPARNVHRSHRLRSICPWAPGIDNAEVWRRKWLAVLKEKAGEESVPYAGQLAMLGRNLLQQKKWVEAETVLHESLAFYQKKEPEHWTTFDTKSLLGSALLEQQKYQAAEPFLVAGYRGMKNSEKDSGLGHHGPPTKQRLTEALERLVRLYEAWGKKGEADKWRTLKGWLKNAGSENSGYSTAFATLALFVPEARLSISKRTPPKLPAEAKPGK